MHQITKQDLQAFDSFLLKRGDEDRTRANRVEHVITFLRNKQGRRAGPPILDAGIHINFTEAPPEAYTRHELEDLFAVSCDDDKMLWRFFIGTGFRESEVAVAEHDSESDERGVRGHAAEPDGVGDGDPFAVGEPGVERVGTRSDRGACAQRAFDRGEPAER